MSQENVELVRWAYEEGHARRRVDVPGMDERVAPDYRFHARPGFPGRMVYRLEEMTALWADLDSTFVDHSLEPQDYEAIDNSHVLVTLQQTALLRGSDQRFEDTIYMLWHVSDRKIKETWTFTTRAEALGAVGLSE